MQTLISCCCPLTALFVLSGSDVCWRSTKLPVPAAARPDVHEPAGRRRHSLRLPGLHLLAPRHRAARAAATAAGQNRRHADGPLNYQWTHQPMDQWTHQLMDPVELSSVLTGWTQNLLLSVFLQETSLDPMKTPGFVFIELFAKTDQRGVGSTLWSWIRAGLT